jgi:hypothetical protein
MKSYYGILTTSYNSPMMVKKSSLPTKHNRRKTMGFNEDNEKLNGRLAMVGFIAAVGAYFTTGQVIPGIW